LQSTKRIIINTSSFIQLSGVKVKHKDKTYYGTLTSSYREDVDLRRIITVLVLLITVLIAGCKDNVPEYKSSSEDVVNRYVEVENIKRLQQFYDNVKNGKKDTIRVVNYTIEGDPLLHDLEYDGEVIKSTFDTRRDKFGEGSISYGTCTSIVIAETTEKKEYLLDGCGDYSYLDILTIHNRE
jgi:hypothetical protein